jgi:hypothetical protein
LADRHPASDHSGDLAARRPSLASLTKQRFTRGNGFRPRSPAKPGFRFFRVVAFLV